ncbi:MAG: Peroxiredoxin OsmC, partial [uncultured Acidimicrobiales bacterium]
AGAHVEGSVGRLHPRGQGNDAAGGRCLGGPLFVLVPLRGRFRHQPGGAHRRSPRGLLLDGLVRRARASRPQARAGEHVGGGAPLEDRCRVPHPAHRPHHRSGRTGARRRGVPGDRQGCQGGLPGVSRAGRGGDHPRRNAADL